MERMLTSYLKLLFSWAIVGSSEIIPVCLSFGSGHSCGFSTARAPSSQPRLSSAGADALRDRLPPAFEICKEKDLLSS